MNSLISQAFERFTSLRATGEYEAFRLALMEALARWFAQEFTATPSVGGTRFDAVDQDAALLLEGSSPSHHSPAASPAPTVAQALTALDDMDDYARMTVGVDAAGPRETLQAFIAASSTAPAPVLPAGDAKELAGAIQRIAAHWAYMAEIDNTDAAKDAQHKHGELLKQLAALASAPAGDVVIAALPIGKAYKKALVYSIYQHMRSNGWARITPGEVQGVVNLTLETLQSRKGRVL